MMTVSLSKTLKFYRPLWSILTPHTYNAFGDEIKDVQQILFRGRK